MRDHYGMTSLTGFSDEGLITDFDLAAALGETTRVQDWDGVYAPRNPNYVWANFLARPRAPRDEREVESMARYFREGLAARLSGTTLTGAWLWENETPPAARREIERLGFHNGQWSTFVAAAAEIKDNARANFEVRCRRLDSDAEWEAAYRNQVAARGESPFKRHQMKTYRELAERGFGGWWGAYLGGDLVGDLGIFRAGDLGRYQMVSTHPKFQRRGICAALVTHAAREFLRDFSVKRLVLVSDSFYHAGSIYESVGFRHASTYYGAWGEATRGV